MSRRPAFERLEDRRFLATVTVSNLNDVLNGATTSIAALIATPGADGISLREAILAANANAAADVIDFAPSVIGEIQLTNVGHVGELLITSNLTINGPGAGVLTIRGFAGTAAAGDGARVFNVTDDNNATLLDVAIGGVTITGGDVNATGAGIRSRENLTLTASTISGNRAHNQLGGGVYAGLGSLVVTDSTIHGNTAYRGGGVISSVATTITSSTISANSSTAVGGSGGGGVFHANGNTLTIVNSTITGNTANSNGGGVYTSNPNPGGVDIRHSTMTLNRADADNSGAGTGGGIHCISAAVILDHTIAAGNLRGTGSTRSDASGPVAARFSLIGDNTGATITDNGGNQLGTGAAPINALLGPLADNGGLTLTHHLLLGSPAIEGGDPAAVAGVGTVPLFDQRGTPLGRVADSEPDGTARIDIGAIERPTLAASNFVVSTLVDEEDDNYAADDLSLREAILLAAFKPGDETITFAASLTSGGPATILLVLGELAIESSMAIVGPGAALLTIDASGNDPTPTVNNGNGSRVFRVDDGKAMTTIDVEIDGLTLTGGDPQQQLSGFGGAIRSHENLSVVASKVTGNAGGPAVYNLLGGLTIASSTLSGNLWGVSSYGGNVALIDSTITGNDQSAFRVDEGGHAMISNSVISGNGHTGSNGFTGAIVGEVGSSTLEIVNSSISDSGRRGFTNFGDTSVIRIVNSTISGNTVQGIANYGAGTISIIGSTVSGNGLSMSSYPAIHNRSGGHVIVIGSTITENFGVAIISTTDPGTLTELYSSIVDEVASGTSESTIQSLGYNLIGRAHDPVDAEFVEPGDQIVGRESLGLGPLADNGGPTMTHALLPASPAINAGDPAAVAGVGDVPLFDQRGSAFGRVANGRIDIGAFERDAPSADFDVDADVDGADFLAWQRGLGATSPGATRAAGNADGDADVDADDLAVWRSQFGATSSAAAAATVSAAALSPPDALRAKGPAIASAAVRPALVDAAMAYHQWLAGDDSRPQRRRLVPWR